MGDSPNKENLGADIPQNGPTKGEQCLLVLILTTLIIFLIFLIVFIIHLALIKHTMSDIFRGWAAYDEDNLDKNYEGNGSAWVPSNKLPDHPPKANIETNVVVTQANTSGCGGGRKASLFGIKNAIIGIVYLNISSPRMLCNALKIKNQWSLVPGSCSALWSDRHLTGYVSSWLTRYYLDQGFVDLAVLRNVPHPNFNRADFTNNIGLLEHPKSDKSDGVGGRTLPIQDSRKNLKLEILFMNSITDKSPLTKKVKRITFKDCLTAIFAVTTPRGYEICYEFVSNSGSCVENGGFLQEDSRTIGFFSWMNRCPDMELPFVVITLDSYSKWIADTTGISLTDLETSSV